MRARRPLLVEPTLIGQSVELHPLRRGHEKALLEAAADGELWDLKVTVVPGPETITDYVSTAMAGRQDGTAMPYVITRRESGRVVGNARFWKIDQGNRKLEIGHTWLSASVQRTGVNTETKFLMLTHAFEVMNAVRVQFTTDELNEKSQAALLRIAQCRRELFATRESCLTVESEIECGSALSIPSGQP